MKWVEPEYTKYIVCPNCGHSAPMKIVASHNLWSNKLGDGYQYGEIWRFLLCPACHNVSVGRIFYPDIPDEDSMKVVFPVENTDVIGLPSEISHAYEAALKVRKVDTNAFAVLLGRVLDKVCLDRNTDGKSLYERLTALASKGDIPPQLAEMAHQLRQLRNIGAHADLGELTPQEVPILQGLCRAILEYVYAAPELVKQVEQRLQELNSHSGSN